MLDRIQHWLVMVAGLTVIVVGTVTMWQDLWGFLVAHQVEIIVHSLMGVLFAATGWYVRSMCEHLRHKLMVGGVLIIAEAIITVAIIG